MSGDLLGSHGLSEDWGKNIQARQAEVIQRARNVPILGGHGVRDETRKKKKRVHHNTFCSVGFFHGVNYDPGTKRGEKR